MNILDKIVDHKKREILLKKTVISTAQLEASDLFHTPTISLKKSLQNSKYGIIAEHKRRSPSKKDINQSLSLEEVVIGYEEAKVCGISVLTDSKFFGGSLEDLILAKACVKIPILRKEFILDEYQILEAKSNGADAILLIASILTKNQIKTLSEFAKVLGLEVLLEVHNLEELEKSIMPSLDMIGVNNRNLDTFEVALETSMQLSKLIPSEFLKISESGISTVKDVIELESHGFAGFLMGENFMKTANPGEAAKSFLADLHTQLLS